MEIGEVIRKYRKEKDMTQEKMARLLGVTASAVNKWENNAAYPDIMLLAPIARLLGISLDILLCYQEKLTSQEVQNLIEELNKRLEEDYRKAFLWAKTQIEKQPNSGNLIYSFTVILNAWRLTKGLPASEEEEEYITRCYERLLDDEEEALRMSAADGLFTWYMRREDYERAEKYLAYYSDQNPEKKRKQAWIYSKTNRRDEAYKAYEELLFTGHNILNMVFNHIFVMVLEDEDMEKAAFLADKMKQLERLFDMGKFNEMGSGCELETAKGDVQGTERVMRELLESVETIAGFRSSRLFEHMKFKEISEEFYEKVREDLKKSFCDKETFGYMEGNVWWEKLNEVKIEN